MALNDVFKVSMIGYWFDTAIVNDWAYKDNSGGSTHIDCATAAGNWMTSFVSSVIPCLPPEYSLEKIRVACVAGPHAGDVGEAYPTTSIVGTATGNTMPSEIAIALSRNTGHASKKNRGRIFLGPVVDAFFTAVANGFVDTLNTALAACAATLIATFTTQTVGLDPVLVDKLGVATASKLINAIIQPINRHRKSRRTRID